MKGFPDTKSRNGKCHLNFLEVRSPEDKEVGGYSVSPCPLYLLLLSIFLVNNFSSYHSHYHKVFPACNLHSFHMYRIF